MKYDDIINVIDEKDIREINMYEKRKSSLIELKNMMDPRFEQDMLRQIELDISVINNIIDKWWNRVSKEYSLNLDIHKTNPLKWNFKGFVFYNYKNIEILLISNYIYKPTFYYNDFSYSLSFNSSFYVVIV